MDVSVSGCTSGAELSVLRSAAPTSSRIHHVGLVGSRYMMWAYLAFQSAGK
jgi:hypothetical protein